MSKIIINSKHQTKSVMKEKNIFIEPELERFREFFLEQFDDKIDKIIASKNIESFKFKIYLIDNPKGGPYLISESGYNLEILVNFYPVPSESFFKNQITQVLSLVK
ncbi:hypothetical protein D3C87_1507770 [compost metagenome]